MQRNALAVLGLCIFLSPSPSEGALPTTDEDRVLVNPEWKEDNAGSYYPLSTKRPPILDPRDYPGVQGVASWKEIEIFPREGRTLDSDTNNSTAAQLSGGAAKTDPLRAAFFALAVGWLFL